MTSKKFLTTYYPTEEEKITNQKIKKSSDKKLIRVTRPIRRKLRGSKKTLNTKRARRESRKLSPSTSALTNTTIGLIIKGNFH